MNEDWKSRAEAAEALVKEQAERISQLVKSSAEIGAMSNSFFKHLGQMTRALTACRGQWIHSIHRQKCLAALGIKDQFPCAIPEPDFCRKETEIIGASTTSEDIKDD